MVSPLCLEWPGQKILDRGVDIKSSIQDGGDGACDRHLDAFLVRQFEQYRRCEGALHKLARLRRLWRLTFSKREAERKVARLCAFAGEDQVAKAGQAGQRLRACPECVAEAEQ